MLLQTKALSVWQIKTYLWKWRGCFVFFKCLISYSLNSFTVKHYILIRDVFFIPPSSLSVNQVSTSALVTHVDELRGPPTVAWGWGVRRSYSRWRKLSILAIVFEVFFSNMVLLLLTAFVSCCYQVKVAVVAIDWWPQPSLLFAIPMSCTLKPDNPVSQPWHTVALFRE